MTGESRSRPAPDALARLRAEVARLEGTGAGGGDTAPVVPLGLAAIDGYLPNGGIGRGRVHEIVAGDAGAAALGAALWFVARLCTRNEEARFCARDTTGTTGRAWLWCTRELPYGPALADFGLAPESLVVARCTDARELLWAAEEGLAAPALGAVLVEAAALGATAARRLALAARQSGVAALLLRPRGDALPLAAATRWRVTGAPGDAWDVELLRARGAAPRRWRVAWHGRDGAMPVSLVAAAADCDGDRHDDKGTARRRRRTAGARPVAAASAGGAV